MDPDGSTEDLGEQPVQLAQSGHPGAVVDQLLHHRVVHVDLVAQLQGGSEGGEQVLQADADLLVRGVGRDRDCWRRSRRAGAMALGVFAVAITSMLDRSSDTGR